jgi:hypothetical protein
MKNILFVFTLLLAFCFHSVAQKGKSATYGGKITDPSKAYDVRRLPVLVNEGDTVKAIVKGTVNSVCQKKGCWMKMDMGNNQTMMVHFKDYGFFVPKDCSGKKITMEGIAFIDVTPVAQLRHYAEDAGKSPEEIAKITDDEKELTFEASGVILYNE